MATTKQISTHALAAKMIRAELKRNFPGITFKVRARVGVVNIDWIDGPTTRMVQRIVNDYQHGDFDGMRDIYEYTNRREDIPQVDYVFCNRDMSRETAEALVSYVNRRRGWDLAIEDMNHGAYRYVNNHYEFGAYRTDVIHRTFVDLSMYCDGCKTVAEPGDMFCAECGAPLTRDR